MEEKHNFIWGINACMQRFGMILFRIFLKILEKWDAMNAMIKDIL